MNKRIKKLDKQAVDYAMSVCDADGVYQGKEYLTVVKEKFAELIVRECVNWIDGSPTTEEGTLILSKSFIIANLKQHFGVEE